MGEGVAEAGGATGDEKEEWVGLLGCHGGLIGGDVDFDWCVRSRFQGIDLGES